MNYDELDKKLESKNFSRISFDTWVYRTNFVNAYITVSNETIEVFLQSVGTNMVMLNRKEKFQSSDFAKAALYCESVADALSHEVDIFVNHCSKLMDRSLFKPVTK